MLDFDDFSYGIGEAVSYQRYGTTRQSILWCTLTMRTNENTEKYRPISPFLFDSFVTRIIFHVFLLLIITAHLMIIRKSELQKSISPKANWPRINRWDSFLHTLTCGEHFEKHATRAMPFVIYWMPIISPIAPNNARHREFFKKKRSEYVPSRVAIIMVNLICMLYFVDWYPRYR